MQKNRWEQEYSQLQNLPSSRTRKPSNALMQFLDSYPDLKGTALDLGSGNGRNSEYLAQQGYTVTGIEFSQTANKLAREAIEEENLEKQVTFLEQSVGEPLPFPDASFDLIIDMMVLHLLDAAEREIYRHEVIRLLKPGGFYLFYTIAADSPAAQELFQSSPGPEPHSYVIPQTGMIEKGFTEEELVEMFVPLQHVQLEKETRFTPAFGDVYERVYYSGIFQK